MNTALATTAIYTQPTARDLEQAVRRLEAEPEEWRCEAEFNERDRFSDCSSTATY